MKPSEIVELLTTVLPNNRAVLLTGAPGVGKSQLVEFVRQLLDYTLILCHPVVDNPIDYKGLPANVNGFAEFLPFGNLREAIEAERKTIYFLDDLGQAPPAVQAAAMQLLLARRVNGHLISDNVVFVAATNRKEDKAGVAGILEPVKSRFVTIVNVDPDLDDWCKWAGRAKMPPQLIAFLRFCPKFLLDFKPTMDLTNSASPRTMENVGNLINDGLPPGLEHETFTGTAGQGFATEFTGFLRVYRKLPDPDWVLKNPDKYDVPEDPATLYALAGALSARAAEHPGPFFKAVCRDDFPTEFGVVAVRDAVLRHETAVTETDEFISWVSKHSNVLI